MRHRSRLLVVALACALALAGCGDGAADDASAEGGTAASDPAASTPPATAPGPGTAIPEGFPLSAGMGGPTDTIETTRTGTGLRDLELCGTSPLRGLGIRDRMVADNSGGESANTRELVLMGNPDEATDVAERIAELATRCDSERAGDMETVTSVGESPFRPEPAATLVQTYRFDGEPGTGATVVHVVPVGAALLVTSTYGQWSASESAQALDETVAPLRETVDALAMFDDGSTPTADAPTLTDVPADLPLAAGLPDGDDDTEVTPPTSGGEGMAPVEMCGRPVWPEDGTAGGTSRTYAGALGPEHYDGRELVVHADEEVAEDAMAAVRAAADECRRHENQVWTVLDRDTGHDTVTMGLTYSDGLGSSVFQVTRVGSARLMVQTYGEGSLASLDRQADEVTETTRTIVPAMCVFTKTGC